MFPSKTTPVPTCDTRELLFNAVTAVYVPVKILVPFNEYEKASLFVFPLPPSLHCSPV